MVIGYRNYASRYCVVQIYNNNNNNKLQETDEI